MPNKNKNNKFKVKYHKYVPRNPFTTKNAQQQRKKDRRDFGVDISPAEVMLLYNYYFYRANIRKILKINTYKDRT